MDTSKIPTYLINSILVFYAICTFVSPLLFNCLLTLIFSLLCLFPMYDIYITGVVGKKLTETTPKKYVCNDKSTILSDILDITLLCILYTSKSFAAFCFLILFIILTKTNFLLRYYYQKKSLRKVS